MLIWGATVGIAGTSFGSFFGSVPSLTAPLRLKLFFVGESVFIPTMVCFGTQIPVIVFHRGCKHHIASYIGFWIALCIATLISITSGLNRYSKSNKNRCKIVSKRPSGAHVSHLEPSVDTRCISGRLLEASCTHFGSPWGSLLGPFSGPFPLWDGLRTLKWWPLGGVRLDITFWIEI